MKIKIKEEQAYLDDFSLSNFHIDNAEAVIEEQQVLELSARLRSTQTKPADYLFSFDVTLTGRSKETILRKLHLVINYEFIFQDDFELENIEEDEQETLKLKILNHFQKDINEISKFNSQIGQQNPLNLDENIKKIAQKIRTKDFKHEVCFSK